MCFFLGKPRWAIQNLPRNGVKVVRIGHAEKVSSRLEEARPGPNPEDGNKNGLNNSLGLMMFKLCVKTVLYTVDDQFLRSFMKMNNFRTIDPDGWDCPFLKWLGFYNIYRHGRS